jgi:type II secretory pathway pseudopilin PulG
MQAQSIRTFGTRAAGAARARVRGRVGMTLLELTIVTSVLVVGFLALSQTIVASMQVTRVNRETALATDALRGTLEALQGDGAFDDLFNQYNDDPLDDVGAGPAPGSTFDVPGLQVALDDPDGRVGEIVFPATETAAGLELHEGLDAPELGMPRDLNGNGFIELGNVEDAYVLLPVLVRLRWSGHSGVREMEVRTFLADR